MQLQQPPSSGEEFIKLVKEERMRMADWSTSAMPPTSTGADSVTYRVSDSVYIPQNPVHFGDAFDDNWLPSLGWTESCLEKAQVSREMMRAIGNRTNQTTPTLPTIQSKKDEFKALFLNYSKTSFTIIPHLSQPIVLRFLKFFIEWIDSLDASSSISGEDNEDITGVVTTLNHLQWVYFLLCQCDPLLEADDIFNIRTLCKCLISKRLQFWENRAKSDTCEPVTTVELEDGEEIESAYPDPVFVYFTLCVALISRGWYGQKDLQDPLRQISLG